MNRCVDTDVLIECLRRRPAAGDWLRSLSTDSPAVPGVVAMELIAGVRDRAELSDTREFLDTFEVIWPEAAEFERAFYLLSQYRLSHGVGISDALIAATAIERGLRLYTFNLKHFRPIKGLDVQTPYTRPTK